MGPRPSRTDERDQLSAARRAVLDVLLEAQEPVTVTQVAEWLGQHANTVREHLEALTRMRMVSRTQVPPQGRGRPASLYRVTPEASAGGAEYAVLAEVLVSYLAETWPDGAEQRAHALAAGRSWGRSMIDRQMDRPPARRGSAQPEPEEDPLTRVRQTFAQAGFDPAERSAGDVRTLLLRRCPVLALAGRHPEVVCTAHLGMAQELLARRGVDREQVSLEAFAEPGACLLHMRSAQAEDDLTGTDEVPPSRVPRGPVGAAAALAHEDDGR
ncbi:helix-turn-helix domain-containing protein [Georgenia sp. 10Sc9-8]|uniref:Helix-turn-helix domain-containing protein n=1 Tax=Georgenia halotolerans TaxID=3028317 RepID=A0ABT5U172_9MICO|nr:helix-turn-helix domain-containing protein [Georgenia halotolerans]